MDEASTKAARPTLSIPHALVNPNNQPCHSITQHIILSLRSTERSMLKSSIYHWVTILGKSRHSPLSSEGQRPEKSICVTGQPMVFLHIAVLKQGRFVIEAPPIFPSSHTIYYIDTLQRKLQRIKTKQSTLLHQVNLISALRKIRSRTKSTPYTHYYKVLCKLVGKPI